MAHCKLCNKDSPLISSSLSLCVDCIRNDFARALPYIELTHIQARQRFGLPLKIPGDTNGKKCPLCINTCSVKSTGRGFCGLPLNSREVAALSWYYDALPTNCVADWVCAGSHDYGYKNLAVFYHTCSFDCLFCQNWHYKESDLSKKVSAEQLAQAVDNRIACICYFGGDPTPQLPHALLTAYKAKELHQVRPLRICWETNGSMHPKYLKEMLRLSLESGGCVKFDLKAWTEGLNLALCGISNKQTLENFRLTATYCAKRPMPPLLVASTLLVPGYVDMYEVERIATFIAKLNPEIPLSLLAFHPDFLMTDLPPTSRTHAERAKATAEAAGLKQVCIGNIHLLSNTYNV